MLIQYSNAANFFSSRGLFVAAWKVWFKRYSDDPQAWEEGAIPIKCFDLTLSEQIEEGARFSVDVICRLIVPWNFRNQAQASDEFLKINEHLLHPVKNYTDAITGKIIPAVRLSDRTMDFWNRRTFVEQDQWMNFAEARLQTDIETTSDALVVMDDFGIEVIGADIYPPYVPDKNASDEEFIKALTQWIEEDPYQSMYHRKPIGDAVSSWHDRLSCFFWPKPRIGYPEFSFSSAPLLYYSGVLAEAVENKIDWNATEMEYALRVADEIFMLMGLPQREVTVENIRAVFEAAIFEDEKSCAKMNSGWSYVAAYATAHLELDEKRLPQAGWCSRVASSLITRLDFLLSEAGVSELDGRFEHIGIVPGAGGTRPREFTLDWPVGYRNWQAHISGSRLIREIRDVLNSTLEDNKPLYRMMPLVGGDQGTWTVRGVELVLFGDGY